MSETILAPWIVVDIEATFCAVMTILLCQACGVHSASTVIDDEQHLDRLLSKLRQSNNKHARMMGDICLLFRGSPIVDRAAVTVPSSGEVVAPKGTKPIPTVGDPLVGLSVPCSGSTGHMSLSRGLRAGHQINEQDFNYGLDDSELAQVHRELEGPNNEWEQILLEIVGEPFSLRAT